MEARLMRVYPFKCSACRNCEIACAFSHPIEGKPTPSRIMAIQDSEKREGKNEVLVCLQCDSAACVAACPARALLRDDGTGAIVHTTARCIHCASCVAACPFGNTRWSSLASSPVKCDLCGGDPLCVKFCTTGAIEYR